MKITAATIDPALLDLPWETALEEWPTEVLAALPRGLSRHIVRFVNLSERVIAVKEIGESVAYREYELLRDLVRLEAPCVQPTAVITGRRSVSGEELNSVLITEHLSYSLPYRALFSQYMRPETATRLIDALAVLLVRLHLLGFYWGDVSLSNTLFRRDAGAFAAYLVDAETGEVHPTLTAGQRAHDLDIARTNLFGEFCDLEAGGMLDPSLDPQWLVDTIEERYQNLWAELTGVEEFSDSEIYRLEGRVRRLNALGFDVAEIDVQTSPDGRTIRMQPKVVEAGHHARRLMRLTGLDAEEHQARRLLNDMDTFRAKLPGNMSESVMAHKWLTEVFEPAVSRIPSHLEGKREPAQFFHELLDYRWYQSQRENREVSIEEAAAGYISDVLATLPDEHMSNVEPVGQELVNKYDPSQGFMDDQHEKPYDPWEDGANDPAIPVTFGFDIDALRAKAARDS